jgi:hypothetical protein
VMLGDPPGDYSNVGHRSDARCRNEIARACCWAGPNRDTRNKAAPSHPRLSVSSPVAVRDAGEKDSSYRAPGSTRADIL